MLTSEQLQQLAEATFHCSEDYEQGYKDCLESFNRNNMNHKEREALQKILIVEHRTPLNGEDWIYISPKEWNVKDDFIVTKANNPIGWFDNLHDKDNYYTVIKTTEALEQSEPRMYEIQYGDGLKTKIEVSDSGIKVIAAVDGWGISVDDNEITIQSLSQPIEPKPINKLNPPHIQEVIDGIRKVSEEIDGDKEKALQFLKDAGIEPSLEPNQTEAEKGSLRKIATEIINKEYSFFTPDTRKKMVLSFCNGYTLSRKQVIEEVEEWVNEKDFEQPFNNSASISVFDLITFLNNLK